MTGSVAIDVSIGLILIFLLYSLLATTIQEMLSSVFAFRARVLSKGVERMLNDEPSTLHETFEHSFSRWRKFFSWIMSLFFYTKSTGRCTLADRFYAVPLIKYQGASKLFRKPSYITAGNFSRTLMQILLDCGQGSTDTEKIKDAISSNGVISPEKFNSKVNDFAEQRKISIKDFSESDVIELFNSTPVLAANKKLLDHFKKSMAEINKAVSHETCYAEFCKQIREYQKSNLLIEEETRKQLQTFYDQSKGDLDKFQYYLEDWFNNTMERVSGWYKKRTQVRLFIWGLILAMAFNIDTFQIVNHLSHDENAREAGVGLAGTLKNDLQEQQQQRADTGKSLNEYGAAIKTSFQNTQRANDVFSISYPWEETDSIRALNEMLKKKYELFTQAKLYGHPGDSILKDSVMIRYDAWQQTKYILVNDTGKVHLDSIRKINIKQQAALYAAAGVQYKPQVWTWHSKLSYVFSFTKLMSFLVTALAISLGAPFWFDLLNKFINMRGTGAKPEAAQNTQSDQTKQAAG